MTITRQRPIFRHRLTDVSTTSNILGGRAINHRRCWDVIIAMSFTRSTTDFLGAFKISGRESIVSRGLIFSIKFLQYSDKYARSNKYFIHLTLYCPVSNVDNSLSNLIVYKKDLVNYLLGIPMEGTIFLT